MPMLYAGKPGSPPIGTKLYDARGRMLRKAVAFDPLTGEVIDYRNFTWLRWLHPGFPVRNAFWKWLHRRGVWFDGEAPCRHHFVPAPIRVVLPTP
jgi:hypothetical protein